MNEQKKNRISRKSLDDFMAQKHIAVAGVSRKKQKFGNMIFAELKKKGYRVYPVNPNIEEYEGERCYPDLHSLPGDVSAVVINTSPQSTRSLLEQAESAGIGHIWLQQGSADQETIDLAGKSNANVISKQCIMMFAEPVTGIHAFHGWLLKVFGKYPK